MAKNFDKLTKPEQDAVKAWARHEALIYSTTVKNFGNVERAARAEEQAEKIAANPEQVKRIVAAVNSKSCQDEEFAYVLKGATREDTRNVQKAVDLQIGQLPEFLANPRECTAEDILLSDRAIPKRDLPPKGR